jgi:hypothetical protein
LVGCSGALKERDLHVYITVAGELTCERETGSTIYIFSGGVSGALGSTIRRVAA